MVGTTSPTSREAARLFHAVDIRVIVSEVERTADELGALFRDNIPVLPDRPLPEGRVRGREPPAYRGRGRLGPFLGKQWC